MAAHAIWNQARRLLVLAPHPDDEVLGCAGLMFAAHRAGLRLRVVVATNGEACKPGADAATRALTARVRRAESRSAAKTLGLGAADVVFWSAGDGTLGAQVPALAARITQEVRADDCVLAPWPGDGHPDHAALGQAAVLAPARLVFYPVWSRRPNCAEQPELCSAPALVRVALDAQARAAKFAALSRFASQLGESVREPVVPDDVVALFTEEEWFIFHERRD